MHHKLVLKDLNFIEINKDLKTNGKPELTHFSSDNCSSIYNVLKKDSQFFASHGLMDYSLLLTVEQVLYSNTNTVQRVTGLAGSLIGQDRNI